MTKEQLHIERSFVKAFTRYPGPTAKPSDAHKANEETRVELPAAPPKERAFWFALGCVVTMFLMTILR